MHDANDAEGGVVHSSVKDPDKVGSGLLWSDPDPGCQKMTLSPPMVKIKAIKI
jgi:hypothetical protein